MRFFQCAHAIGYDQHVEAGAFDAARAVSETADRSANPRLHVTALGTLVVVWREGTVVRSEVAARRSGTPTYTPLSPRQPITPTPNALFSENARGALGD